MSIISSVDLISNVSLLFFPFFFYSLLVLLTRFGQKCPKRVLNAQNVNVSTETQPSVHCEVTCSQRDTALLLLLCDWTDAEGNGLKFCRERRECREASNTTHLNRAQCQVTNKARAILNETVWKRKWKIKVKFHLKFIVLHFNLPFQQHNLLSLSYLDMSL